MKIPIHYPRKPADLGNERVRRLCRRLSPGQEPLYLARGNAIPVGSAFDVIDLFCRVNGGEPRFGWAIRELANLMLEAEPHAVWVDPDGITRDVLPSGQYNEHGILFLPDERRSFYHRGRATVRAGLNCWGPVRWLIARCRDLDRLDSLMADCEDPVLRESYFRKADNLHHQISALVVLIENRQTFAFEMCPCGSRRKHDVCCGKS